MNTLPLPRILIIDDDENDFFIISDLINSIPELKCVIDWSYTYDEALRQIRSGSHNLYFVDYYLGSKTGLDLLAESACVDQEQPMVLLTGISNREVDVRAMEMGAFDYLVKSELNTEKLERCIRYSLERAASLNALKAHARKFQSIFEKSKDAIFLADERLVFREINNAASDLFRYTREELLRRDLFSLFASPKAAQALQTQLEIHGAVETLEIELETKNKEKKSFTISVSREKGPDGNNYFQGIIRDITNLKRIEKANMQIERLQSTAMLLRTLAHEVRNPLTNISLSLDYLKSELNSHEGFMEIIDRNLRRIDMLVTELLNSARPGMISSEKTSLQSVIDTAAEAAKDRIALKRVVLKKEYPEEMVLIMADPEKLKIAFLNIIINAVEAMKEDSGLLDIRISNDSTHFIVLIKDNGSGISEENLSKIFEPYFTSKSNGFGLGLSSALNIFQSHHALVDVQSEVGSGTSFFISFNKTLVAAK